MAVGTGWHAVGTPVGTSWCRPTRLGCRAVRDSTLVAWYRSFYAPRTGGAYDSHHRTAGIAGRARRRGMAACGLAQKLAMPVVGLIVEPLEAPSNLSSGNPTGRRHHPTVDLDPVPVRVEEIEGVAPATADESLLASLGGVHVGTTDDIHAARAHMVERQEPVLARVDLESDVIEARGSADAGVGRCDACLPHVLRKLEQHHIVVLVVDAHEANGSPEVGRTPTPRYLETQHLAIEVDRAIDIADMDANVPNPA